MALPATVGVTINFSDGPAYAQAMILDQGLLGTNVLANSAAIIIDYSAQTTQIATRRARDLINDIYNTGSASVKILDPDGDFNPTNTLSPIYGFVKPLRKIQITATYGATTYSLFSGYISEYRYTYPVGQEIGYVTVQADGYFGFELIGCDSACTSKYDITNSYGKVFISSTTVIRYTFSIEGTIIVGGSGASITVRAIDGMGVTGTKPLTLSGRAIFQVVGEVTQTS